MNPPKIDHQPVVHEDPDILRGWWKSPGNKMEIGNTMDVSYIIFTSNMEIRWIYIATQKTNELVRQ